MGTSTNGSLNKPSRVIRFDNASHMIRPAKILAKKRNGDVIGQIRYTNLKFSFVGNGLDEISFEVHKKVGRNICKFWDELHGLLIIDYVGYGLFEADFTTNVTNESIKTCTAVSLETELGQYTLHQEAHYNDEPAYEKCDYTQYILVDKNNQDVSVLHKILKDKAPHWSIGRIPDYLNVNDIVYKPNDFQRMFNFEGKSIYEALQNIQEESNCLFTFDTYNRVIDCWNIEECVFELATKKVVEGAYYLDGIFYDKNAKAFEIQSDYGWADGIGNDTSIIVSQKELATDFTIEEDKDSVKNCFYVKGGDDVITNMVAAANVTGNNDIIMFDQFQYDDMPENLVDGIKEYQNTLEEKSELFYKVGGIYLYDADCTYDSKTKTCRKGTKILTDAIYDPTTNKVYVLDNYAYQKDGNVYDRYDKILSSSDYKITTDAGLFVQRCQINDRKDWLENSKFPDTSIENTTAEEQFNLIQSYFTGVPPVLQNGNIFCQKVIVQNVCSPTAYAHVTSTIQSMFCVIADSRYEITILSGNDYPSNCTGVDKDNPNGTWAGYIKIENEADESDSYTGQLSIPIEYISFDDSDKSVDYLQQSFYIALAKLDTPNIDYYNMTDDEFTNLMHYFNYNSLCSYANAFQSCCNTLDDMYPKSDSVDKVLSDTYDTMREKFQRFVSLINPIKDEVKLEIDVLDSKLNKIDEEIREFRSELSIRTFLGEDNYKLFRSYIREDEYSNDNYSSEGLNTYQTLELAKELLDVARSEIKKACVLQKTVSSNINNIFSLPKYKNLFNDFAIFNYIRARIEEKLYKLRIVEIDYDETDLNKLNVIFSDTVENVDGRITDLQSLKQAVGSISSSFSSTKLQAKQGASAMSQFDRFHQEGIISADYVIKNSTDEEVTIDNTGILCKSMNDIGMYGNHQCRFIGNGLYLSDDAWNTPPKAAIGLMKFNGEWQYGVIADMIIGNLLLGKKAILSDENGTVTIDGDGIHLSKGAVIDWSSDGSDGVQTPSIEQIDGLDDYLEQLDGRIQTFSQTTDPSIDWTTTALKEQHSGDIWINPNNGLTKQWTGTKWVEITDSELKKLAESKAQIFTSEPKPPYYVGDLLIPDKDIKSGTKTYYAKKVYKYDGTNWTEINYTDDTKADTVDTKIGYFQQNVNKLLNADLPTTENGSDYVFSPYIGGGYLYIKGDNGSVEINPKLITGYTGRSGDIFNIKSSNDTSVFNVNTNGQVTIRGGNSSSSIQLDGTNGSIYTTNGSSKSILASGYLYSTDGTYTAYLNNAGLDFKKDDIHYARFSSGYWIGTKTRGVSIHSYADSKFISFGNKTDNSQDVWTTPIVLNYGLNPYKDRNDPSQGTIDKDVIIFGTTYHNSNVYFNNDSYVGSSSSTYNGIYVSDAIKAPRVYAGNYVHGDYALDVNGESYFGNKITLNAGTYLNGLTGGGIYCSGKFFIEGDLTVNGIGVIKQLSDGGHSISIGWNGSALDILVDSTHMYPAMSGHNLWTHDITWTDSGNARTNPSLTSSVYNLACVQYVKDNFTAKSSDERVKCNFNALPPLLDTVFDNLKVQEYEYKDGLGKQGKFWGETAQHVNCILEQNNLKNCAIVGQRKVDYDNGEDIYIKDGIFHYIDTDNVTWLCVDQIQKLKKRVSELELELQQLKQNN